MNSLPNVSPGIVLGGAFAGGIVANMVGMPRATPILWASAGVYSLVKGRPWWGAGFIVLALLSEGAVQYVEQKNREAGVAQAQPKTTTEITSGVLKHIPLMFGVKPGK
jgi:hypothetical protein